MPNLGTDKSARTVHIEKNNSKCISNLYIAMTHLRINKFSEPPVCITLLVSPPLICAESVRFDVVSTENVRITSVTVDGKNGTIALHMSRPKCYIFIKVLHVCECLSACLPCRSVGS